MKRYILVSLLAIATAFFYSSCTRIDTTDLGNDLIPVVDNVNTFQTILDIVTDNVLLTDTTRMRFSEDHALGVISSDPVFGKTTASIYVDMRPATFGTRPFSDSTITLDSVVLSLAHRGTYGDTSGLQKFNVQEINLADTAIFKDSIGGYLISHPFLSTGTSIGSHTQDLTKLNDDIKIREGKDTLTIRNQMRIRLNNTFGQRFINYTKDEAYAKDSAFSTKFAGLGIIPDSTLGSANALAYFNIADQNTKLTFYYKAKNGSKHDTLATSFVFSNFTNFNKITRNFSGTEFNTALNNANPNDDKLYIQSAPGSYASLKIPGLGTLSNRVVHRAELIIEPLSSTDDQKFTAPTILFLDAIDTVAKFARTIQNDFVVQQSGAPYNVTSFGGLIRNSRYTFNLTRYVQGIVTRKEKNFELRLYAPFKTNSVYIPEGIQTTYPDLLGLKNLQEHRSVNLLPFLINPMLAGGRTVVAGGSHPDTTKKMKLRIIYSKI